MNNADVCVCHRERERERRVSEESVRAPETRSAEDSDNFLNLESEKIWAFGLMEQFFHTVQLLSLTDPTTQPSPFSL